VASRKGRLVRVREESEGTRIGGDFNAGMGKGE
jgi:hypothetical protein